VVVFMLVLEEKPRSTTRTRTKNHLIWAACRRLRRKCRQAMLEHLPVKTSQKTRLFTNLYEYRLCPCTDTRGLTKVNKTVRLPVKLFTKTCIRCLNMEEPYDPYVLTLQQPDS